jgi:hypothetical protein
MADSRSAERRRPLDSHTAIRIAAESVCDPRTVQRVIKGGGSPMARAAVKAAADRLGISLATDDGKS